MKKILIITVILLTYFSGDIFAYHNFFFRSASDLTSGTLPNARLDPTSATLQGNSIQFNNGSVIFGDGSSQGTAAGSSQWIAFSTVIYNSNTGQVGIGITSPTYKLEVRGSFYSSGPVVLSGNNSGVMIGTSATNSSLLDVFGGSVTIRGAGAGLDITGGNVGIGTLGASSVLDVNGGSITIRGTNNGLKVGASNFMVGNDGQVGIGTDTPASKLTISSGAGTSSPILTVSTGTTRLFEVDGSSIVFGVPVTLTGQPDFTMYVTTTNGFGSTNGSVRRFAGPAFLSSGAAAACSDSSVFGTSCTIATAGKYFLYYEDEFTTSRVFAITWNVPSAYLSAIPNNIPQQYILSIGVNSGNGISEPLTTVKRLSVGDIIRFQADSGGTTGGNNYLEAYRVEYLGQ